MDKSLHLNNGIYNFKVYRKTTKQPTHWSSKIPKRCKRNMILRDLHRSNRISSNSSEEIRFISQKYSSYEKADYPKRFINSVIRQFQDRSNQSNIVDFDYIIPANFFDIPKSFILIELPFCETNEIKPKHFLKKFHRFTKDRFEVAIKWETRKVKTLFPLKDKSIHPSCMIYKGSCGESYIGEDICQASIRWQEHNDPTDKSEPAKHLKNNFHHAFNGVTLRKAPQNYKVRRNLEASYIAFLKLTLNEQKDFY